MTDSEVDSASKGRSKSIIKQCWEWIKYGVKNITLEPVMFFHTMGSLMMYTLYSSFLMEKICQTGSNWFSDGTSFNETLCETLDNGEHVEEQVKVQKTYSRINMVESYIGLLPSAIFIIFGSAWSDRHGRKVIMFFPWLFHTLSSVYLLFNIIFFEKMSTDFIIFRALISDLMGGTIAFNMGAYTYIADVSSVKHRVTRIVILDLGYYVARMISSAVVGPMYQAYGYISNIYFSIAADLVGILYLLVIIREPKRGEEEAGEKAEDGEADPREAGKKRKKAYGETLHMMKDGVVMLGKKRENGSRHIIWLLILCYLLFYFARGDHAIDVPYTRRKFEWDTQDQFNIWIGNYHSITTWCYIAGVVLMPVLNLLTKHNDIILAIISSISGIGMAFIYLISWTPWILYLSNVLGIFGVTAVGAIKSYLSKLVNTNEIAKIMGCLALTQIVTGAARPVYNIVYNATLDWFVGFIYCFAIGLYVIIICILLYIFFFTQWARKRDAEKGYLEKTEKISTISS